MVPPRKKRATYHGGILQIWVGRMCNKACFGCTQGSQLAGKPGMIAVEQFERAVESLADYWGTVALFGGLATLHPRFPELCEILRRHVPFARRGLWANDLNGHGAVCRETFNPAVSNLNVHLDAAAREEMARDWPESEPYIKGHDVDSIHSTPFVAMRDLIPDERERLRLIGQCDINKYWSAMICVVRGELRGFFCEVAGSIAMLHQDNPDWCGTGEEMPDVGVPIEKGWWKRPMADFADQVRQCCHACGVPLRRPGQAAIAGSFEEFSKTHEFIARPKVKGRPVVMVESIGMVGGKRPDRPATQYLPGTTPGYRDR